MRKLKGLEELLVDHMEGELEPALKKDFDLMMDKIDQNAMAEFKLTKEVLRQTDSIDEEIEKYDFASLHERVMASVEKEKIQPRMVAAFTEKHVQTRMAMVVSLVLVVGVAFGILLRQHTPENIAKAYKAESDLLVLASAKDPDVFADSLISEQNDVQFLMDAAAQKISQLDKQEAEKIMNEMVE